MSDLYPKGLLVMDRLIEEFFEIIDTYYDERAASKIRDLLINAVDGGPLQELRKFADERR